MFLDLWQLFAACLCISLYLTRFFYLKFEARQNAASDGGVPTPKRTLIVLGSGGHTTEMLRLLDCMPKHLYYPRYYFLANTDLMSLKKLKDRSVEVNQVYLIPRSREVGQSYVTSVFSTIKACLYSIPVALWINPDLLMVNGPGTCLPVCIAAVLANLVTLNRVTIVFVESLCRTQTLSLTGKILYRLNIADLFFVQWEKLKVLYSSSIYLGRVV